MATGGGRRNGRRHVDTKLFTHEELAEKLALVLYLLGIVSVRHFLNIKKHAKRHWFHT
jgi:hypothetical protein